MSTPPAVIAAQIARDLAGCSNGQIRADAARGDPHAVTEALRRWDLAAAEADRLRTALDRLSRDGLRALESALLPDAPARRG